MNRTVFELRLLVHRPSLIGLSSDFCGNITFLLKLYGL